MRNTMWQGEGECESDGGQREKQGGVMDKRKKYHINNLGLKGFIKERVMIKGGMLEKIN